MVFLKFLKNLEVFTVTFVCFSIQAFKIAEEKLKVPALLDAQDLVSMKVVDELSVMTYVSMLYKRMNKRSSSGESWP